MTNAEAGRSSGVQAIRVLFKAGMVAWIEVGSFEIVRLKRSVDGFEFKSVDQPAKKAKDVLQAVQASTGGGKRVALLVPGIFDRNLKLTAYLRRVPKAW